MVHVMEEAIASMDREVDDKFSLILFAPVGTELDLGLVAALAGTFQDNYPERLHRLYALPTGMLTRVMWEGVRPFLSANTAAKVVLTSGGHRPRELEKLIPVEVLREAGGGPPSGCSHHHTCHVRAFFARLSPSFTTSTKTDTHFASFAFC